MFGSIFYNFWGALLAFSTYFFLNFLTLKSPTTIIINAFIWAIVGFIAMFAVRFGISYVLHTPEDADADIEGDDVSDDEVDAVKAETAPKEFQEEDPAEVADAVRTMMHSDEDEQKAG